jgi:hypothetical protein
MGLQAGKESLEYLGGHAVLHRRVAAIQYQAEVRSG